MKDKAINLAKRVLANPELIKDMSEDTFFKFVMGIAKFDHELAIKVERLMPFTNSSNKINFWTATKLLFDHCDH
jgi:hypothetical protein